MINLILTCVSILLVVLGFTVAVFFALFVVALCDSYLRAPFVEELHVLDAEWEPY